LKDVSQFYYQYGNPQQPCKNCRLARKVDNSKIKQQREDRKKPQRDLIYKLKDVPCSDCGERYPTYCMEFDHLKKDEKRDPAIYLLTSLIWNLVNKNNDKKRMLFIDEAHKLLVDPEVAVFYRELVKQARKRNVGVVSITQDVEDFLNNEYGKAIITNS
jgi:type IV secretory pathway VirB4 component